MSGEYLRIELGVAPRDELADLILRRSLDEKTVGISVDDLPALRLALAGESTMVTSPAMAPSAAKFVARTIRRRRA